MIDLYENNINKSMTENHKNLENFLLHNSDEIIQFVSNVNINIKNTQQNENEQSTCVNDDYAIENYPTLLKKLEENTDFEINEQRDKKYWLHVKQINYVSYDIEDLPNDFILTEINEIPPDEITHLGSIYLTQNHNGNIFLLQTDNINRREKLLEKLRTFRWTYNKISKRNSWKERRCFLVRRRKTERL